MTHFFIGDDVHAKDQKISELKKKILTSRDAGQFDYEILHGHKLSAEQLKKSLIALPAVSEKRLVILKECHRLSPYNKKLILHFVKNDAPHCELILDSDSLTLKDTFVKNLSKLTHLVDFGGMVKIDIFDLTKAIERKKRLEALEILSVLLDEGNYPLQILGVLVWHWGRMRNRLSFKRFEEGLKDLQDTDLRIKRSRLRPEYALEVLVVRLCY